MNNLKKFLFVIVVIIPYASFGMEKEATWDSKTYDKNSSSQEITALNLIEKARELRPITKDSRCIDIGCGTGNVTAKLAEMVPHGSVFGIDSSIENIKFARKKYGWLIFGELKAQELTSLSSPSMYDIALFTSVLHFIPAAEQLGVLKGIHSILKPGGRLLLLDGKCCETELPYSSIFETLNKRKWLIKLAGTGGDEKIALIKAGLQAIIKNYPSEEQLQTMINDAGFEGDVTTEHHVYRYENKEALMAYFRGPFSHNPLFFNMEKTDQDSLLKEIADDYMEKAGVTEGNLDFHLPLLTVIATKPE